MKLFRFVSAVLVTGGLVIGAFAPKMVVVRAQVLPATRTLAWDANPAADGVIDYTVRLDGVVIGTPTGTTQAVTFTTAGIHTLTVVARNTWGTGIVSDTLTVDVRVPGKPANLRIP